MPDGSSSTGSHLPLARLPYGLLRFHVLLEVAERTGMAKSWVCRPSGRHACNVSGITLCLSIMLHDVHVGQGLGSIVSGTGTAGYSSTATSASGARMFSTRSPVQGRAVS